MSIKSDKVFEVDHNDFIEKLIEYYALKVFLLFLFEIKKIDLNSINPI